MGVELTHDIAHHAGAFLEARGGIEPELLHGVDQPPMHGLQPVAHIGQAARHDGGEGISEVAVAQRAGERRFLDMARKIVRHGHLREARVLPPYANNK